MFRKSSLSELKELKAAIGEVAIWWTLALRDISYSYRRTLLGPWWYSLDQFFYTLLLSFFGVAVFEKSFNEQFVHVGVGLLVWSLFAGLIENVGGSLINSAQFMNSGLSNLGRCIRSAISTLVVFVHRAIPIVTISLVLEGGVFSTLFLSTFGLLVVAIQGFGFGVIYALINIRYRDLGPLVSLILRLTFFASPIFWHESDLRATTVFAAIVRWSPVVWHLKMVRDPFLYDLPSNLVVFGSISVAIATSLIALLLIEVKSSRIAYYL